MRPGSIQARLSRWLALQAFAGLSLICVAVYSVTSWSFGLKQEQEFSRHKDLVLHLLDEPGTLEDTRVLRHKLNDFFRSHDDVAVELLRGATVLYSSVGIFPDRDRDDWAVQEQLLRPSGPAGDAGQVRVRFAIDVRADQILLRRLRWTLLAAVVLGSALIAGVGIILIRRGLDSLRRLALETAKTGPGHVGRRIDAQRYDIELQPWIEQFNELLIRVERAHEQLVFFNADVAHELRTPLANLISEAEVVLAKPRDSAEIHGALLSSLEEARRLSAVITDMLFLSQADRGALARRSDTVELADQVQMVLEYHEDTLEASALSTRIVGAAQAHLDAPLIRRATSNLVANAIRFANVGSTIEVRIEQEGGGAIWILVANQGAPIHPNDLPRLFERFFRTERSRAGSKEHHGLGLAIVSAVARMHDGRTVASSDGSGTVIGFLIAQ